MTRESDLPDLLSAASLLLTLITFLYGLLYPELSSAAKIQLGGRQREDVTPDRERIRAARLRAVFLATAAGAIGAVFAPPSIDVSWHFLRRLPDGLEAFDDYDAVAMTLVAVTAGCFVLALHASYMVTRLTRALDRLSPRQDRPG